MQEESSRDKVWYLIIALVVMFSMQLFTRCDENTETEKPKTLEDFYVYRDIYTKCIEGHVYYLILDTFSSALAPKLDDNGMPIKCEKERITIDLSPLELLMNGIKDEEEEPLRENEDDVPKVR